MLVRSGQAASACRAVIWLYLFAASNLVASFGFQLCMGPKCLSCWPLFAVCLGHGHRISRWLNTFENTSIVYRQHPQSAHLGPGFAKEFREAGNSSQQWRLQGGPAGLCRQRHTCRHCAARGGENGENGENGTS